MKNWELDRITEALNHLERAVIRNGLAKKHLLDITATRQAVDALRKRVEKGNVL
jgi:hypothetical protein